VDGFGGAPDLRRFHGEQPAGDAGLVRTLELERARRLAADAAVDRDVELRRR
jgi:hypothetical protein